MQLAINVEQRGASPTVIAAFAAIYLLWGGTYLAIALGLRGIPPFLLMGSRAVLAGAALLALSYIWDWRLSANDWLRASIGGVLLFAGCHGSLGYAQRVVPSGISAVMLATIPFWMVLLQRVFRMPDRPGAMRLLALIPGFAGVALIAWQGQARGNQIDPEMLLLLLAAALAWAAGSIYSQSHAADIPAAPLSGMQMMCGGAVLVALSLVSGEGTDFSFASLSAVSLASFAYLALAGGVVAFTSYNWLLERISAPIVATYTFVNPVIAVLLGWAVLREQVAPQTFAGIVLVIGSLASLVWLSHRASHSNPK